MILQPTPRGGEIAVDEGQDEHFRVVRSESESHGTRVLASDQLARCVIPKVMVPCQMHASQP
jgi:hypothetical protein